MAHQSIVEEIQSATQFLQVREKDDPSMKMLQDSFTSSLVKQVNAVMYLNSKSARTILDALRDSLYGDDNLARITLALDSKIIATASSQKKQLVP